ncbi:hypothetical protein [Pseudomonas sp. KK4]|uniref:hypothetical protein n=1 Tax=Pseudomonas sp. KK4 TaxID=1855729 RepID=UPI00097BBE82|nr:hypothetical protein [Pseudomonas sp. KK4]
MKHYLAFGLLSACVAMPLFAAEKPDECEQMDGMAETVMHARQSGVPMAKLYKIAVKDDGYVSRIYKMLIDGAYKENRFSSPEYQAKAVTDYRNIIFQACVSNRDKKT